MSYMPSGGNHFNALERPQTANVLSKIQTQSQYRKMGPAGPSGKNPSTAASSNNPKTDMYSSRGFGELGQTKR